MGVSRPHFFAAIALTIAVIAGLCVMAPRMYPLVNATPENFWYVLTGVELRAGAAPRPAAIDHDTHVWLEQKPVVAILDRDRFVFGCQYPFTTYPDYPYRTISSDDAQRDFPAVQSQLAKRAALHDADDYVATGYTRWLAIDPDWRGGISGFLSCIDQARADWLQKQTPPRLPNEYVPTFKQGLRHVSSAARLYWACFVFESIFFVGIIWFALFPYIVRRRFRRKFLHLIVVPVLFFLPLWFGYCNPASPAFPTGGILYPFFQITPRFPGNFRWESIFLASFPPIFETFTQGRALNFADYSGSLGGISLFWGPANVAGLSAFLAISAWLCNVAARFVQKKRERRGFPVIFSREI